MHQIRFVNKEFGTWIFLPLYVEKEFILDIHAKAIDSKGKRKVEISLDKPSPLELELLSSIGSDDCSDPIHPNKGYVFNLDSSTDFHASVHFRLSSDCDDDLNEDNHIGKIVNAKSQSLVHKHQSLYENARQIYEYVFGIPFTNERLVGPTKPKTPTQVITSKRARKCVCKAKLFKDLCIASGIPARVLSSEYYDDEHILKYENQRRRPSKNHSHSFVSFYSGSWHLVDPTLGGFDGDFQVPNYFDKVVSAKGVESIEVSVRKV